MFRLRSSGLLAMALILLAYLVGDEGLEPSTR